MDKPHAYDAVLGPRDVVVVEGTDAMTYLQSQVSQDLRGQQVGEQRWTFVLAPNGKVEAFARVTRTSDERFDLDTDAGFGPGLLARVDRFKIRVNATSRLEQAESPAVLPEVERERIELGWPKMGAEIIPGETIPASTGMTSIAVCFTKGCYPGQELVERMDSRAAEAPRSLRRIVVDLGAQVGDDVTEGDIVVGELTSVAGTAAICSVKRSSSVGVLIAF